MRIIAGALGSRRLVAPRGLATRPTSDRVRQALFDLLGPPLRPAADEDRPFRVLDLFAGSGALALEALSRGADEAVLVDEDRAAVEAAERNIAALGLAARAEVIRGEAGATLRRLSGVFDWVFVDPPYEGGALDRALRLLGGSNLIAADGLVIAEHDARTPPDERRGDLVRFDQRSWGTTAVSLYRREGA